ncbi:hypothetical protein Lser_V15G27204 [Lactuca serriola]
MIQTTGFAQFMNEMESVQLSEGMDVWHSKLDADGRFTVGALRRAIDKMREPHIQLPDFTWSNVVPIKVNCFIWRAIQRRIPTLTALRERGVETLTNFCSACINEKEDVDHLLISCPHVVTIREILFRWCGIPITDFHSVIELHEFINNWGQNVRRRDKLRAVCYGLLWGVWKFRNERAFNNVFYSPSQCADRIISMVHLWSKSRSKCGSIAWEE